jgi:20S proteasome alpha/beta subunit
LNGDGIISVYTNTIEAAGVTSLVQVSNNYFLNPVSGGTGPTLQFGGAAVVAGGLGGWAPIAAEANGGGYEVAMKMQGQDLYTVWYTDSSGNYVGNANGAVPGSNTALEAMETSFHQDLNGDGIIGIPTTIIESNGATSLVQVSANYFLNPVGGGTGPVLQFGGAAVVAGSLGGWAPIAAEANAGGYEVAMKMQGQDLYTVWYTDSSGNYVGNANGAVSGSNTALEAMETSFHQDLNGDGVIGIPTTIIESNGATSLAQVASSYFLNPVGGGTGPTLKFGGTAVVAGTLGGWTPIAAEASGGGYEVAFKMQGQDLYTVWNTDSSGNYVGNANGAVSGSNTSLEALETSFHQDLNGDGTIGIPAAPSMASALAVTALTTVSSQTLDRDEGGPGSSFFQSGSYLQDSFHFATGGHGRTVFGSAADPMLPPQQQSIEANAAAFVAHDAFVFASNVVTAGIAFSSADNTDFIRNVFAAQDVPRETLLAAIHAGAGSSIISDAGHDMHTIAQVAPLLAHQTDFQLI